MGADFDVSRVRLRNDCRNRCHRWTTLLGPIQGNNVSRPVHDSAFRFALRNLDAPVNYPFGTHRLFLYISTDDPSETGLAGSTLVFWC